MWEDNKNIDIEQAQLAQKFATEQMQRDKDAKKCQKLYDEFCKQKIQDNYYKQATQYEEINHPKHYVESACTCKHCKKPIECIDITRTLDFDLGNVVKYIWRSEKKGDKLTNLKKAQWYLNDEIARLEKLLENHHD